MSCIYKRRHLFEFLLSQYSPSRFRPTCITRTQSWNLRAIHVIHGMVMHWGSNVVAQWIIRLWRNQV